MRAAAATRGKPKPTGRKPETHLAASTNAPLPPRPRCCLYVGIALLSPEGGWIQVGGGRENIPAASTVAMAPRRPRRRSREAESKRKEPGRHTSSPPPSPRRLHCHPTASTLPHPTASPPLSARVPASCAREAGC
ncbi:Os05g0442800 [Oryza sativa Japonica Group]|uniref:Os05g0442800 protein n=1 Tax=Oryza sativa subsp. japonica TaxID=39947 RepID=A0A0N7KKV3_ORYSJ|nr:hypothetical protein DAI22_05g177600 [Oryza sativa Japonica Group]BAS94257.1 Os05g0442800 [Oryza sativa Japonica Group]